RGVAVETLDVENESGSKLALDAHRVLHAARVEHRVAGNHDVARAGELAGRRGRERLWKRRESGIAGAPAVGNLRRIRPERDVAAGQVHVVLVVEDARAR